MIASVFRFLLVLIPAVQLVACSEPPPPVVEEVPRPVKTLLIETPEMGGVRQFPARIDAYRKAELAFRVAGKVEELLIKEGEDVAEGQLVARLDPTDFQIVVKKYPLTFKEVTTKADAKPQTFEVTFTTEQVAQATVLPGMTAMVTVDLSKVTDKGVILRS